MTGVPSESVTVSGQEISVNSDGCAVDDLSFCGAVTVTVPATVDWDDLVAVAVEQQWVGVEALSAVPGTVAEVVARSAAAYGQGVADTVASVRTWDRISDRQRTFASVECEFDSGGSRFIRERHLDIIDVAFLFRQGDLSEPVRDEALAALLGARCGVRMPLARVRAVIVAAARHEARAVLTAADLLPVEAPASVGDLRSWRDVDLPGLGRRAEIYAWLPPGYAAGQDRYPVLYLHDGDNTFLHARSYGGESWQVGEAMSALAADGLPAIVIAIPCHGELRGEEYTQYPHVDLGGGRAADYATFLVQHLKPAVDAVLRTKPDARHTVVAGSSLGGVVSAYLWERYPDTFGGAGLFSPAFWWPGEQAIVDLEKAGHQRGPGARVYLDVGGHEQPEDPATEHAYVVDAERVLTSLRGSGVPVRYVFDSAAYHFETAWRERFPSATAWLLAGYATPRPSGD